MLALSTLAVGMHRGCKNLSSVSCSASLGGAEHLSAGRLHAQGLQLPIEEVKIKPHLLASIATYAAGRKDCVKAVIKMLPDLCQVCVRELRSSTISANKPAMWSQPHWDLLRIILKVVII